MFACWCNVKPLVPCNIFTYYFYAVLRMRQPLTLHSQRISEFLLLAAGKYHSSLKMLDLGLL